MSLKGQLANIPVHVLFSLGKIYSFSKIDLHSQTLGYKVVNRHYTMWQKHPAAVVR